MSTHDEKCSCCFAQETHGQAGGLPDRSRWLSEAWRATPPESSIQKNSIPEGCQSISLSISGTPPGGGVITIMNRWCRSLTLPQPPAKIWQASGLQQPSAEFWQAFGLQSAGEPGVLQSANTVEVSS